LADYKRASNLQRAGRPTSSKTCKGLWRPAKGRHHQQPKRLGRRIRGKGRPAAEGLRGLQGQALCQDLTPARSYCVHCQGWLPRALPPHRCQVPPPSSPLLLFPAASHASHLSSRQRSEPPMVDSASPTEYDMPRLVAKKLCHFQVFGFATYLQRKGATCKGLFNN